MQRFVILPGRDLLDRLGLIATPRQEKFKLLQPALKKKDKGDPGREDAGNEKEGKEDKKSAAAAKERGKKIVNENPPDQTAGFADRFAKELDPGEEEGEETVETEEEQT